jgi:hypothetical protein
MELAKCYVQAAERPCCCCCSTCCSCFLQKHGLFAELLVVLLLPYCRKVLQWYDLQRDSAEAKWVNLGADQLLPYDAKLVSK